MIRKFTESDIAQSVEVIYQAFKKDPLFEIQFKSEMEKRAFAAFLCRKVWVLNETGMVYQTDDAIQGIASLERSSGKSFGSWKDLLRWDFIKEIFKLKRTLSAEGFKFINQYMRFTTSVRPKSAHYYLVFIGVSPLAQGRGIGGQMLNHIHAIVDADQESIGIGLDTENEANVAYYEQFGYALVSQTTIDQVTIYAMFRTTSSV